MFNYNLVNPVNIHYRKYPQNEAGVKNSDEDKKQSPSSFDNSNANGRFPNGNRVAIDYTKNKINISQVLQDFRSTISAINTPDDVKDEVEQYLTLVTKETSKDSPSREIVLSNLKNAARVTDKYIQDSLKKPSKVVQDWVDALFLQQINLKADPNDINEAFRVQIPDKNPETTNTQDNTPQESPYDNSQISQSQVEQKGVQIPSNLVAGAYEPFSVQNASTSGIKPLEEDTVNFGTGGQNNEVQDKDFETSPFYQVQNAYIETTAATENVSTEPSYTEIEPENVYDEIKDVEPEPIQIRNAYNNRVQNSYLPATEREALAIDSLSKAKANFENGGDIYSTLKLYDEAIEFIEGSENINLKSAIYFERAKVFDSYDYPELALIDFHKATRANDNNLQTQAYLKMGNIYDDYAEFEPAMDQYSRAIESSEEINNLQGKTRALRYIAAMFAKQYDKENTEAFSNLALESAEESNIPKTIANTYLDIAGNYKYMGEYSKALKLYGELAQNDAVQEDYDSLAINYREASLLMDSKGNKQKAYALMQKSKEYQRKARLARIDMLKESA